MQQILLIECGLSNNRITAAYRNQMSEFSQEILRLKNYHKTIEEIKPLLKFIIFPVLTRETSHNNLLIRSIVQIVLIGFLLENRREDFKMIEKSMFHYQLKINSYTQYGKRYTQRLMQNSMHLEFLIRKESHHI